MERYKRYFNYTLNESFESQKAIYQIVDNIIESIRKHFVNAAYHFYVEEREDDYTSSHYFSFYKRRNDPSHIFTAKFNMKQLLRIIEDNDLSNMREYRYISSFYDKYPYAVLEFEAVEEQISTSKAHYAPQSKDIKVFLNDNMNNVISKLKDDTKMAIANLFYYNKISKSLTHEFTHLYDDVISQEKAITKKANQYISTDISIEGYLKQDAEVNARFYTASYVALREKLNVCSSQQSLKYQWDKKYFPIIEEELVLLSLSKDQQNKIYKRAWTEFTTLNKYETDYIVERSIQVIINNGDITKADVRLKDRKEPAKQLKQYLLNLQDKKISTILFKNVEPLENEEWQKEIYSEVKANKAILGKTKWQEADNFYNLYIKIKNYEKDDYDTKLINNILEQLRLDMSIIEDIKNNYGIK